MPIASPRYSFTRSAIDGAPDDPGVYALYKGGELVYYGAASGAATILSRLLLHFAGVVEPRDPTHYAWEICRDPAARHAELLREHERALGRLPSVNALHGAKRSNAGSA
ncbi:MAG TPA: hypothetical protein VM489_02165 [Burkholderiales bacterium]|nr:hypothetical protein [Burkholderiales bacterium]